MIKYRFSGIFDGPDDLPEQAEEFDVVYCIANLTQYVWVSGQWVIFKGRRAG